MLPKHPALISVSLKLIDPISTQVKEQDKPISDSVAPLSVGRPASTLILSFTNWKINTLLCKPTWKLPRRNFTLNAPFETLLKVWTASTCRMEGTSKPYSVIFSLSSSFGTLSVSPEQEVRPPCVASSVDQPASSSQEDRYHPDDDETRWRSVYLLFMNS